MVSHVVSLLISHTCQPSALRGQVVTHFYLKEAFIYKGHNVVVLTERVGVHGAQNYTSVIVFSPSVFN